MVGTQANCRDETPLFLGNYLLLGVSGCNPVEHLVYIHRCFTQESLFSTATFCNPNKAVHVRKSIGFLFTDLPVFYVVLASISGSILLNSSFLAIRSAAFAKQPQAVKLHYAFAFR
jgi:hypothetical protein